MASKVNIDAVSESLSEVLKKADEFNIKKRSILENIKELERAIPLFERLVSLYEKVGENDPRANTYFRLAQQIASRNDEGMAAGYNELKWEAKQADAMNASDRLSNEEAEAIGKLARSSKLSEFVMEFDMENLQRFRQFKELIKAVTEQTSGMSRKDAQTRRVSNVRDILREYGGRRKQYPANDPYGTIADGDTPFYEPEQPANDEPRNLPNLTDKIGALAYRNGKWYRLSGISYEDGEKPKTRFTRVSAKQAQAELGPSEYAAIRRRGELEEKAVASIQKTSQYIADLEPAGSSSKGKDKKEKKSKKKKNEQSWGEALLQLAKWAGYGVATLGAIAGAAALVPKVFELVKKWHDFNDGAKKGAEKFRRDAANKTAEGVQDTALAAKEYDEQVARWKQMYGDFSFDKIQGNLVGTTLGASDTVYGNDTLRRRLSLNGISRNSQFTADIQHALNKYKETGEATFYSTANKDGSIQLYHLGMFADELPELSEENKAGLRRDYAQFALQRGVVHMNARTGWGTTNRTIVQQGLGVLGGGIGLASPIPGGTAIGYGAGVTGGVLIEAAQSDFRDGMSLQEYQKLSPQEQAALALKRVQEGKNRGAINYALNYGYFPKLTDAADMTGAGGNDVIPREMLGELIVTPGWIEKYAPQYIGKQLRKVREAHALHALGVIDFNTKRDIVYEAAGEIVRWWDQKAPSKAWKEYNFDNIPSQTTLANEMLGITDMTGHGDINDNLPENLGGRPSYVPNVISQTYYNQTNVFGDDNAQQVGGKL